MEMSGEIIVSDIAELIGEALLCHDDVAGNDIKYIRSFHDEGLLTNNSGLVIGMVNGSEFQVTIVQSK